jgi:tRNA pseudouridine13 synthase
MSAINNTSTTDSASNALKRSASALDDNAEPAKKKQKLNDEDEEEELEVYESNDNEETPSAITEEDLGIKMFLHPATEGFSGKIKQRYTDFLVNEVGLDDQVAHLTDIETLPAEDQTVASEPADEAVKLQQRETEVPEVLGSDNYQRVVSFMASDEATLTLHCALDLSVKANRTRVHDLVRKYFADVESETHHEEGTWSIKLIKRNNASSGGDRKPRAFTRLKFEWPKHKPAYLQFYLYKENKDTNEVLNLLSKMTGFKPKMWSVAGTKDKRGVTCQRVTAWKVHAERLRALNQRLMGIKLGNFKYVPKQLELGDLNGNRFTVVLRNVTAPDHVVNDRCISLRDRGFINYFGTQRFGTGQIPTHVIGKAVLRGDYKQVIELILKPRPGDNDDIAAARRYYAETSDIGGTLSRLPFRGSGIERSVLQGLQRMGATNYKTAFQQLTKNMRLLYVHAYQSWLWNTLVSERIQLFGTTVVVGDLVLNEARDDEVTADQQQPRVRVIESESEAREHTIEQVVLPLPGFAVKYPSHAIGARYRELMSLDHVDLTTREGSRDYILPGSYRKLVIRPRDVTWQLLHYDTLTTPLTTTDLERLQGSANNNNNTASAEVSAASGTGQYKALRLGFTLPSSCYATMCLRELTKQSTTIEFQKSLPNATVHNAASSTNSNSVPATTTDAVPPTTN